MNRLRERCEPSAYYEKLGLKRVGAVARFRDRADAPRLAYRHWCTRTVDEPSYMMAKALTRGGKKRGKVSIELDEEVCRASFGTSSYCLPRERPCSWGCGSLPGMLTVSGGLRWFGRLRRPGPRLALADSLQTFRGSSDQKPDAPRGAEAAADGLPGTGQR